MPHDTPAAEYAAREREALMTGPMMFSREAALTLSLAPDYVLNIYNLGPLSWMGANAISKGSAGRYHIPACEKGMPYTKPIIIPSIVVDTYMIENEMKTHSMRGEDLCIDIVHPAIGKLWSVGQNLDEFGVFWSRNNPPSQEELRTARTKLEKTFRGALAEATTLEAIGKLEDITPIMRFAADYFEENRPWNKIYKKTAECPACLGPTKDGAAIHTCGAVLDWAKAIRFGLKTRKDAELAGVYLDEQPKRVGIEEVPAAAAPEPAPKKKKAGVDLAAKARDRAKKQAPK